MTILRDITERKQIELALQKTHNELKKSHDELEIRVQERTAELKRANEELEVAFQARLEAEKKQTEAIEIIEKAARLSTIGVMAAGITHEIAQPLNAIKVTADSILYWEKRNQGVLPQLFVDNIKRISDSSKKIEDIIGHIRSFWIPSQNKIDIVDFGKVVNHAQSLIERQLCSHGIKPIVEIPTEPLMIQGNPVSLEQIVINLVNNAMRAIDASGKKDKKLEIKLYRKEKNAFLAVMDNGVGLAPGVTISHLCNPFYYAKKSGAGMGLGLCIVKNFVDRMQGSIAAQNNEWGGATFTIGLPIAEN